MWAFKNHCGDINNVGHHLAYRIERLRTPCGVSYIVQCLHMILSKPKLWKGGVPATCAGRNLRQNLVTVPGITENCTSPLLQSGIYIRRRLMPCFDVNTYSTYWLYSQNSWKFKCVACTNYSTTVGMVRYPRAYWNQFREFSSHRVHILVETSA